MTKTSSNSILKMYFNIAPLIVCCVARFYYNKFDKTSFLFYDDKGKNGRCKTKKRMNMTLCEKQLMNIYQKLYDHYGYQKWWPGESAFEIIIGAILTQNTAWINVEKAICNLACKKVLSPHKIKNISEQKLAELIRPSGYYNIKAKRIKAFIEYLFTCYHGKLGRMFMRDTDSLRKELLHVNGIGPETADSILLYAGKKKVFVVDAYTRRIFSRKGLLEGTESYDDIQKFFMNNIPKRIRVYNDYHAQIVMLGKNVCKPKPRCDVCPINTGTCKI